MNIRDFEITEQNRFRRIAKKADGRKWKITIIQSAPHRKPTINWTGPLAGVDSDAANAFAESVRSAVAIADLWESQRVWPEAEQHRR